MNNEDDVQVGIDHLELIVVLAHFFIEAIETLVILLLFDEECSPEPHKSEDEVVVFVSGDEENELGDPEHDQCVVGLIHVFPVVLVESS